MSQDAPEPQEAGDPKLEGGDEASDDGAHALPTSTDASPIDTRAKWLIVALLVIQLLVPATYYLRDDPYDERFAWRMFSGVRLQECESAVHVSGSGGRRRVDITRRFHGAWLDQIRHNSHAVIGGVMARECEANGARLVEVINVCHAADGAELAPQHFARDCTSGATQWPPPPARASR